MSQGDNDSSARGGNPHDERGVAGTYLELAKMSQESFFNRRSYEFKVAFGFWVAIGLITYVAVEHGEFIGLVLKVGFGIIYSLLLIAYFFWWQIPIRRAFAQDQEFKHYYMHCAEGRPTTWPRQIDYWEMLKRREHVPWIYAQTVITALFMVGSFVVICAVGGPSEPERASVEFKASGASVDVHTKSLDKVDP